MRSRCTTAGTPSSSASTPQQVVRRTLGEFGQRRWTCQSSCHLLEPDGGVFVSAQRDFVVDRRCARYLTAPAAACSYPPSGCSRRRNCAARRPSRAERRLQLAQWLTQYWTRETETRGFLMARPVLLRAALHQPRGKTLADAIGLLPAAHAATGATAPAEVIQRLVSA